ncbi:hypothetical protein F4804DRAFT_292370 [Jackrogersella minutella]|nr:hypothetical protein F4804DRAFT_292370 [Jackrogersella minutella]
MPSDPYLPLCNYLPYYLVDACGLASLLDGTPTNVCGLSSDQHHRRLLVFALPIHGLHCCYILTNTVNRSHGYVTLVYQFSSTILLIVMLTTFYLYYSITRIQSGIYSVVGYRNETPTVSYRMPLSSTVIYLILHTTLLCWLQLL